MFGEGLSIPDTVWTGVVPLLVNDMTATGLQVGQGFTRRYALVAQPEPEFLNF